MTLTLGRLPSASLIPLQRKEETSSEANLHHPLVVRYPELARFQDRDGNLTPYNIYANPFERRLFTCEHAPTLHYLYLPHLDPIIGGQIPAGAFLLRVYAGTGLHEAKWGNVIDIMGKGNQYYLSTYYPSNGAPKQIIHINECFRGRQDCRIQFGRGKENDLNLSGSSVSRKHGSLYFNLENGMTEILFLDGNIAENTPSTFGTHLLINPDIYHNNEVFNTVESYYNSI